MEKEQIVTLVENTARATAAGLVANALTDAERKEISEAHRQAGYNWKKAREILLKKYSGDKLDRLMADFDRYDAGVGNGGAVTSYADAAARYAKEVKEYAQAKGLSLEKALAEKLKTWSNEILSGSDMPRAIKKNLGI